MKEKRLLTSIIGILIILLLSGCGQSKRNIRFVFQNFTIEHESKEEYSEMKVESYEGQGTIIAVGDSDLVKKPYSVLIKVTRIKGGLETDTNNENIYPIDVCDGMGTFTTSDRNYLWQGEEKIKSFEKPEYKIEILGYIPYLPNK